MRIKNFGGYSLGEYLGGGLYTKVYKAYSFLAKPTYGNPVAIKVLYLKGNVLERNKLVKQFEREAEIAMNLEHPNIVKVYNFGKFDHHYAMIMEYIDGKNLKEFLYEREKWDLDKILKICYSVGKGLEYIHQHNIVHKDVKPDNILISHDFQKIKITDFGIAKPPLKFWQKDIFPKSGTVTKFGVISYISKEQAEGNATFHSDIYSYGITIDEVITAKLYIEGKEEEDYFKRIDIRAYRKNTGKQRILCEDFPIPHQLKEIIKKATEEEINMRYQSMTQLLNDLEVFLKR
ncbi:MAG: serine/threonine protein kinase [bacterium]|nr:serine/threonine protein kinase [bacterium]MCX7916520.1 serine/threonine protein kinase [bacterium]MDW8163961.1 serine/threonine-protein kinase [Candidatus Omnitrophota bacterium]